MDPRGAGRRCCSLLLLSPPLTPTLMLCASLRSTVAATRIVLHLRMVR